MRAQMRESFHWDAGDSHSSPAFFVCYSDPYHPKCVVSLLSEVSCFPLSAHGPPLFTRCMVSCHLAPGPWPLPPITLLMPSYLLAVTIGNKYNFPGVTSPLHAMCFQCRPDGEQCQRHLPPPWYKHRPKWGTWTSTPAFTCWYSVRGSLLKQKS